MRNACLFRKIHFARLRDSIDDDILLLEHEAVITFGKSVYNCELLASKGQLDHLGISFSTLTEEGISRPIIQDNCLCIQ